MGHPRWTPRHEPPESSFQLDGFVVMLDEYMARLCLVARFYGEQVQLEHVIDCTANAYTVIAASRTASWSLDATTPRGRHVTGVPLFTVRVRRPYVSTGWLDP